MHRQVSNQMRADCTVNEALEFFLQEPGRSPLTKKKYRDKFKFFLVEYGERQIDSISLELLEKWFLYLQDRRGYSDGNLAFHRSSFFTFFKFCSKWTGFNPAQYLPRYSQKPARVITADPKDVEKVLKYCEGPHIDTPTEKRDAAIFAFGTAGLRRSNIAAMRYTEVIQALDNPMEINGRIVYIFSTGGKQKMEAVLDERRADMIQRYIDIRPKTHHDRLFISIDDQQLDFYLKPLSMEGMLRARNSICKRAGVDKISFQKMRRLMGTMVARKHGVSVAAQVLGHTSGVSVIIDHYYDPDKEAARIAAIDAISNLG